MRSAPVAMAWEVWARRRAGFVALAVAVPAFAGFLRWVAARPGVSDDLKVMLLYTSMAMAIAAMFGLVNFAQEEGFPRRLFVRPVRTWVLVTCPMAYGVAGVVGLYVLWAAANGGRVLGLVAAVLGAGVVSFQAIVWVLARHRLWRIAALAGLGVELVTLGCAPMTYERSLNWRVEGWVEAALVAQALLAHAVAVIYVRLERTGGAEPVGNGLLSKLLDRTSWAMRRQREFKSPARALEWMEWRRGGMLLPVGVAVGAVVILAGGCLAGHGSWRDEATVGTLVWLAVMPVVLAAIVGIAFGRPDAWSMDGRLPSVVAMRPVRCGQIVAAKLRVAAWGTLLAWGLHAGIVAVWIAWGADRTAMRHIWQMLGSLWGPWGRIGALAALMLCGMAVTWRLATGSIWAGLSRRATPVVACVIGTTVMLIGGLVVICLWDDDPHATQRVVLACLEPAPWVMAGLVTVKVWLANGTFAVARRRELVSSRFVQWCVAAWVIAVAVTAIGAYRFMPAIPWARDLAVLTAMLAWPLARLGAAPLSLAGNRHR